MSKKAEFRLTKQISFIFNVASGIIFFSGFVILIVYILQNPNGQLANSMLMNNNILFLLLFIGLIIIAHELLHGLCYIMFGAKVKYGMKLLNVYTMDISGKLYNPLQMLVIMLIPLFGLSALLLAAGFLFPSLLYYITVGILFNLSGSVGDFSMAAFILFRGKGCKVRDEDFGFSLYT